MRVSLNLKESKTSISSDPGNRRNRFLGRNELQFLHLIAKLNSSRIVYFSYKCYCSRWRHLVKGAYYILDIVIHNLNTSFFIFRIFRSTVVKFVFPMVYIKVMQDEFLHVCGSRDTLSFPHFLICHFCNS